MTERTESMKQLRNNAHWLTGGLLKCPKCKKLVDENTWMDCFPEPDECPDFHELEIEENTKPAKADNTKEV